MRILIVEDNQKKLDKLKEYISKEFPDYEITDRQSYNSATKEIVLNYKNYDLMLLDMSMIFLKMKWVENLSHLQVLKY